MRSDYECEIIDYGTSLKSEDPTESTLNSIKIDWLIDWFIELKETVQIDEMNNNFSFDHLDTRLYQGPR